VAARERARRRPLLVVIEARRERAWRRAPVRAVKEGATIASAPLPAARADAEERREDARIAARLVFVVVVNGAFVFRARAREG